MTIEIKITGNTTQEVMDSVNELTQSLVLPVWKPESSEVSAAKPEQKPKSEAKPEEKKEAKPEPEPKTPVEEVTKNDIKKALVPILQEKRDEVQDLFEQFGVNKLSELATTDYSAFLKKVQAL
ncbi:hypothetical protein [Lapidilactobacillus bayanensis]|uniref:hypothetical protein n=1 Tax=Lapidilactobacillus bayanensis TaxID=2485998 RepID=UPI000F7AE5EB|nr:hypothetical protein [Lapidilactobacillus bayanensis]